MDTALQRIALAMLRGGGAAQAFAPPKSTTPVDLQRMAQIQAQGAAQPPPAALPVPANPPMMPPVTASASPLPASAPPPDALPPGVATGPPTPLLPMQGPGMVPMQPMQTGSDLEAWRALMDKLQFARQGQ